MRTPAFICCFFGFFASVSLFAQPLALLPNGGLAQWNGMDWKTALGTAYPKTDVLTIDATSFHSSNNYAFGADGVRDFVQLRIDLKSTDAKILNKKFKVEVNVNLSFP